MTYDLTMLIDLHMHSAFSDGTDSPEQLLKNVKAAGITLFSLTDHDAVQGCVELQALISPDDPRFIPGVEFSCSDELGKYHILGYRYDPQYPSIQGVVSEGHGLRMKKLQQRLDFLDREFGFRFPDSEIKTLYSLSNPGKPHIAKLMVKMGFAESKEQAMKDYLNLQRIKDGHVHPQEAIEGILGAGGIPVLAHPCYGDGDQLILGDELEQRVVRLMGFGMQGLEGFYSGFTAVLRDQVLHLAQKHLLYVTAGSDYHGSNKLVSLADTGMGQETGLPDGLKRFLEQI